MGRTRAHADAREPGHEPEPDRTAQLLVANRFIEPLSEWALIDWAEHTALPELLETNITKITKSRLYLTGDELLGHRVGIETALREHERDLFSS